MGVELVRAPSPEEGIARLARDPFDLVIDAASPGAWLLDQVRVNWPGAARVAVLPDLSMPSVSALRAAHQLLAPRPSSREVSDLVLGLQRARALLDGPDLARLVGAIDTLPAMPQTSAQLSVLLRDDDVPLETVARVIERDPGTAAKVLQVVNSAYYRGQAEIRSIHLAACRLGLRALSRVVLAAEIAEWSGLAATAAGLDPAEVSRRSARAARIAGQLAADLDLPGDAVTPALLADLGPLLLGLVAPRRLAMMLVQAPPAPADERLADHLAGYLLGTWGVPGDLVDAVAHLSEPAVVEREVGIVSVAHVATRLARGATPALDDVPAAGRARLWLRAGLRAG